MNEWYIVITPQNQEELRTYMSTHHSERARTFPFKEGYLLNFVLYSNGFVEIYYLSKDYKFNSGKECSSLEELKQNMFEYKLTI